MTELATEDPAVLAYDALAPVYDSFTAHHDYELWVGRLLELASDHGLAGVRALDAGCGTGKSFLPLLERGFNVTACDQSPAMLALAVSKVGTRVRIHCRDLRRLEVVGEFDLITCLDDVANHLMDAGELAAALAGLAANLRPGGVLLFDVNTVATYRTFFRETTVIEEPGLVLVWRGLVGEGFEPGDRGCGQLDSFTETDGGWARTSSLHEQRHHGRALVESCLRRAGLRCVGVYGQDPHVHLEPGVDELRHSKAIYVATR
jgi:SAM-dependent methyltransferase